MTMLRSGLALLVLGALLAACSGAGAAADDDRGSNIYRTDLGTSSRAHLTRTADEALLNRYGYRFERRVDTVEDIRFETEWKALSVTEDERAQGYTQARTRITITARPRSRSGGAARTYSARFVATTQLQKLGSTIWEEVPLTPEREEYIREIADYLETEFRAGLM